MQPNLGRRPLEVKLAFILALTLLLPGVTSMSIVSTAITPSDESKTGELEEKPALYKVKLESSSKGEDSTEPDGTLEDHDTKPVSDSHETETADLEESSMINNETGTSDEEDALALFSLLVKRAVEEEMADGSEEDKSDTNSIDEDKFSISDLPKLLKPLIDAFSSESSSEAPSKDDFLSWFPSLKDLFQPNKPKETEATNSATRSGRRSSFSAASQPHEPTMLPSSEPHDSTIFKPPITIGPITPESSSIRPETINPPDDSDSDEDSETDF